MSNETQHNDTPNPEPAASNPEPSAAPEPTTPAEPSSSEEEEDLEAQLAYENLKRKREARKRKRIIIASVVGAVVLLIAIVFVMRQTNKAAEQANQEVMATGSVYMGDFSTTVTANGATEPVKTTVVSPEVDGIVEDLQVQEGDTVKEGDVLFTIKNETLDKEVHTAETDLSAAQRAADSADRAVSDAYNAYNKAVDDYNNAVQNAAQAAASGDATASDAAAEAVAAFDDASLRSAISTAEDAYQTAQDAVQSAQEKVNDAKKNADKRVVRAPVSGTIVSLNAKNGTTYGSSSGSAGASSGTDGTLMQISDLSTMKVTVQVNEVDISKISKGQTAKATFSAIPGLELDATVEHIASVSTGAASSEGGSSGVVTYAVDLIIPKPDPALKPGMTATVTITTQSAPNSLIVPSAAVQDGAGEDGTPNKFVTVVDDEQSKKTHDVPVEVVAENSSEAAVKGNLKDGDKVLLGAADAADAAGADVAGTAGATGAEVTV
ncbi:MAG: efflux RND transporter periplasmic adaptor subunit [Atopobiaceae bacterium]|nr:efflux RND transporter periplasmic adaptor subunit [Atopobiaceae bacterium]